MPRDALFDQAVNRAAVYLDRLTGKQGSAGAHQGRSAREIAAKIELWYLKTRFAYRAPLAEVAAALAARPPEAARWAGGRGGRWVE